MEGGTWWQNGTCHMERSLGSLGREHTFPDAAASPDWLMSRGSLPLPGCNHFKSGELRLGTSVLSKQCYPTLPPTCSRVLGIFFCSHNVVCLSMFGLQFLLPQLDQPALAGIGIDLTSCWTAGRDTCMSWEEPQHGVWVWVGPTAGGWFAVIKETQRGLLCGLQKELPLQIVSQVNDGLHWGYIWVPR